MNKFKVLGVVTVATLLVIGGVTCLAFFLRANDNNTHTPTVAVEVEDIIEDVSKALPETPTEPERNEELSTAISSLTNSLLDDSYMSKYFTADDIKVTSRDGGAYVMLANCSRIGYEVDAVIVYFVTADGEIVEYEDIVELSNYLYKLENPVPTQGYITSTTPSRIPEYRCINSSLVSTNYTIFDAEQLRDIFTSDVTEAVRALSSDGNTLNDVANFLYSVTGDFSPTDVVLLSREPLRLQYADYLIQVSVLNDVVYTDFYKAD